MNATEAVEPEGLLSLLDAVSIQRGLEFSDLFGLLLTLTILLRLINYHTVKWPPSIMLAFGSFGCTLVVFLLSKVTTGPLSISTAEVRQIFSALPDLILNYMLGFLLFASASEVDMRKLKRLASTVFALSIISTCISAFVTGVLTYLLLFPFADIGIEWCLLYGAIVSPTDPVVIQSILKQDRRLLLDSTRYFVVGESLLNDFMGVILYIVATAIVNNPALKPWSIVGILTEGVLVEGALGVLIGIALAWCAFSMIHSVEDHLLEVAITFALVGNVNLICRLLGASIPLASVSAGLVIGNFCDDVAFSHKAKDLFREMWSLVDEAMNSILFLLIGATDVFYDLGSIGYGNIIFMMVGSVAISLFSRFTSVAIPLSVITVLERVLHFRIRHRGTKYGPRTVGILTWGGMRGGISIALVLAVPDAFADHAVKGYPTAPQLLFFMTFAVVIFAIGVQGLSFAYFVKAMQRVWKDSGEPFTRRDPPNPLPPGTDSIMHMSDESGSVQVSEHHGMFSGLQPLPELPPLHNFFANKRRVRADGGDLRRSFTVPDKLISVQPASDAQSATDPFDD
jgi:monovalent cation:H+ antiporter, CPA1 family